MYEWRADVDAKTAWDGRAVITERICLEVAALSQARVDSCYGSEANGNNNSGRLIHSTMNANYSYCGWQRERFQ